jgi:SAM-dependent methyltransferase
MSIVFHWDPAEMEDLLATCLVDGCYPVIQKFIPKGSLILESGCGAGRYVKYLQDRGYKTIGLEISSDTTRMVKRVWPELNIIEGDSVSSPFLDNSFDTVLSLGVVEHWPEGPQNSLTEILRVLRPGGIALITVPCLNLVRRFKRWIWWEEMSRSPRALAAKVINRKNKPMNRLKGKYQYAVYPAYGDFLEYRLTPQEFWHEIHRAGFKVLEHRPHGLIDGVFHELNPFQLLVKFNHWKFFPNRLGRLANDWLSRRPFAHCHMQLVVAQKPR